MHRPGRTRASLPLLRQPCSQGTSPGHGVVLPRAAQCSRVLGCAGDFPVCRLGQGKLVEEMAGRHLLTSCSSLSGYWLRKRRS